MKKLNFKKKLKQKVSLQDTIDFTKKFYEDTLDLDVNDDIYLGIALTKAQTYGYLEGESQDDKLDRIESNLRELGIV